MAQPVRMTIPQIMIDRLVAEYGPRKAREILAVMQGEKVEASHVHKD